MFAPLKVEQKVYENVFEFSIQSAIDGSIAIGKYKKTWSRQLQQSEVCSDCSAADLQFYVSVIDHDPK